MEFLLRRSADILSNYLPQKTEYVVFVAPTAVQLEVYRKLLNCVTMNTMISHFLPMSEYEHGDGISSHRSLGVEKGSQLSCGECMILCRRSRNSHTEQLLRSKEDDEDALDGTALNVADALASVPRTVGLDISLSGEHFAVAQVSDQKVN